MITTTSELELDDMNDANIPVNIFVLNEDDDGEPIDGWRLVADNFMPRKNVATSGAYEFRAETREELVMIVKENILPLYMGAIRLLEGICNGTNDALYYWDSPQEGDPHA